MVYRGQGEWLGPRCRISESCYRDKGEEQDGEHIFVVTVSKLVESFGEHRHLDTNPVCTQDVGLFPRIVCCERKGRGGVRAVDRFSFVSWEPSKGKEMFSQGECVRDLAVDLTFDDIPSDQRTPLTAQQL